MERLSTRPISNILHQEEELASYYYGGLHPVCLGDEVKDGRYRVVHKLGVAAFPPDNRWAALKILKAKSRKKDSPMREVMILEALQDSCNAFVPALYDEFIHDGPNGPHICIVSNLLGPSLQHVLTDYSNGGDRLEPDDILRLSGQLLEAIALPDDTDFAHGDLSATNVAFTTRNLASLSEQALLDVISLPEPAELLNADGSAPVPHLPRQLVGTARWDDWTDECEEDICLVDFGESFRLEAVPDALAQTIDLRVPENLFGTEFNYKVDLWRLGCVIFALIFHRYPTQSLGDNSLAAAQMIDFVEDLPPECEEAWQKLKAKLSFSLSPVLEPKLVTMFRDWVSDKELAPLLPVIQGPVRARPAERMSARAALQLLPEEYLTAPTQPDKLM
ncbi:hypothetical protein MY4038_003145 [Beauveria bassiana]